jgi:hypothetical protein
VLHHNLHDLRDVHHDGVPRDALRDDGRHDVRHDVRRDVLHGDRRDVLHGDRRDDVHHDLRDDPIVLVHTSDFDFANFHNSLSHNSFLPSNTVCRIVVL